MPSRLFLPERRQASRVVRHTPVNMLEQGEEFLMAVPNRLGSLQCLDLCLLIYTEHDGVIRWIQI